MITFWAKLKQEQGAGHGRKFESASIIAAMSNRCWHLANEFTNFTAQTRNFSISMAQTTADAIVDTISR